MPRFVEADLDAPDAGEEADDGKLSALLRMRPWMHYAEGHQSILWISHDVTNICSQA